MDVLVGDIGGTNVRFAMAGRVEGAWRLEQIVRYPGDAFDSLEAALARFLDATGARPRAALFGIAGPVDDDAVALTNRAWPSISGRALERRFAIDRVLVRNDFEVMARAAPELGADAFRTVRGGLRRPGAPILVAGPGTGFGLATLAPIGARWRVIGGEGGHQAYAPGTDFEWAVARRLAAGGYVSIERVAAGAHYGEVVAAVRAVLGLPEQAAPEPDALIVAAREGEAYAAAVCGLRAAAILQACGDGVLAVGARGGCILAGGVAERLFEWLVRPESLARFDAHGPMSDYMRAIDVQLMVAPTAPLIGAAALFADNAG